MQKRVTHVNQFKQLSSYICECTPYKSRQRERERDRNHPGLAEIPASFGSQEVVATPTNVHCWLVNICLGAGLILKPVQDGSHLIDVMICIDISRVGWATRACRLGGMHCQERTQLQCSLKPLYCIKLQEVLTQKLKGPILHTGLWKYGTCPAPSYCLNGQSLICDITSWDPMCNCVQNFC